MNKNLIIGLGVLAVAGIGLYILKRRKDGEKSEEKSKFSNAKGISIKEISANQYFANQGLSLPPELIAPKGYMYYATPSNQQNCGSGCRYFLGICWCLKLGKASGTSGAGGECPLGTQCCSRIQNQCVQCCTAGSGVRV